MTIFRLDDSSLWFCNGKNFSFMFWFSWSYPFFNVRRGHRVDKAKP